MAVDVKIAYPQAGTSETATFKVHVDQDNNNYFYVYGKSEDATVVGIQILDLDNDPLPWTITQVSQGPLHPDHWVFRVSAASADVFRIKAFATDGTDSDMDDHPFIERLNGYSGG